MRALKFRWILVPAIFAVTILFLGAGVSVADNPNAGCSQEPYADEGNGANEGGAYDDTCDGSASENGNGDGSATGKPCAGCVGRADEKNPPGQDSDGSDGNNGYECDGNNGISKTNPAHTGCEVVTPPPDNPPADDEGDEGEGDDREETPSTPGAQVLGRKFLAQTGVTTWALFGAAMMFLAMGVAMRRIARPDQNVV